MPVIIRHVRRCLGCRRHGAVLGFVIGSGERIRRRVALLSERSVAQGEMPASPHAEELEGEGPLCRSPRPP